MPVVPANCVTRRELHQLINRCDVLIKSVVKGELSNSLYSLLLSAARVDGVLADLSKDAGPHPNHKDVFTDDWPAEWYSSSMSIDTDRGPMSIEISQQIVHRVSDGAYLATDRYRLKLNNGEWHYGPAEELRGLMARHLDGYVDALNEGLHQHLLDCFQLRGPDASMLAVR